MWVYRGERMTKSEQQGASLLETRLYIIGAGFAGQMIARDLMRKKIFGTVAAFLDDNTKIIGTKIDGIPVLGPIDNMSSLINVGGLDEAIIAIPSAPVERIRQIYTVLKENQFLHIKILPSISQVIDGKAHLAQTREINPLDILGRNPVIIPPPESLAFLRGKRVNITGAGGSIGSELARQLLSGGAERLYLFGHGENSIYQIDRELRMLQKDRAYTDYIISHTKCDVVFHCAAYKHVPMMEENPVAAIENNVFGTKNLLDACIAHSVHRFVLISTDKAVAPVSVYGGSKMLCEKLILEYARQAQDGNAFMCVRFGNVLGSRGSILPLFMEQIKNGGPVTVTTPEMERFFMTIPEACSLVLRTGGVGTNGSSYLLDMGTPIRISELAEQIIRFSGFEPYKDIDIKFVGARKGERNVEPRWLPEEEPRKTSYEKLLQLKNMPYESDYHRSLVDKLRPVCIGAENTPADASKYRNRDYLVDLLCGEIPSLHDFYKQKQAEEN